MGVHWNFATPVGLDVVLPERRTAFRNMVKSGMDTVRQFKPEWTLRTGWQEAVYAMMLADELDLHGATEAVDTDKLRAVAERWAQQTNTEIGEILERGR